MIAAFRAFEVNLARRGNIGGMTGEMNRSVVMFSAASSHEVAFETEGHGYFSYNATRLLQHRASGLTNEEFVEKLQRVGGEDWSQHPVLECVPS